MTEVRKRIAILGAGWAGLACGVELAIAGVETHVFEAAPQAGGRARRRVWQGLAIDNGQHLMLGAYRETRRLIERLGTGGLLERHALDLRLPDFRLRLPRLPPPLHLTAGLLGAHGIGAADKLAAARFIQSLKQAGFRLAKDTEVTALLDLHRQPRTLRRELWEPLCLAALNTPASSASAQVFCNVLRDSLMGERSDSDALFARADLGRLFVDPAIAGIEAHGGHVHLNQRIEAIEPAADGIGAKLAGECFSAVVYAGHPAQLSRIHDASGRLAEVARQIAGYQWQPILTTWLHFDAPVRFPYPMLGLGPGQAPWAFDRSDLGPGLVALVVSAEGPHLAEADAVRTRRYLDMLQSGLGPMPPLRASTTVVEKRATYACVPGMARPGNRLGPGLYLAGDYTEGPYPATLEGAVRSGVECARWILRSP